MYIYDSAVCILPGNRYYFCVICSPQHPSTHLQVYQYALHNAQAESKSIGTHVGIV